MTCKKKCADDIAGEMCSEMGGFMPNTLQAIHDVDPDLMQLIRDIDRACLSDGELDRKTKRLIALACVCIRGCEDCVYPQAKVAKNYGATKKEILEVLKVCVLTGGVPCWSTAKKGIQRLFSEWE